MQSKNHQRRVFLQKVAVAGITAVSAPHLAFFAPGIAEADKKMGDRFTFLFQGDSITDGNRGRDQDPNHVMGHGYTFSIASKVGACFPEKNLTFYNRGISGNTIPDLIDRWPKDTLDLKPDVLSILVGINDTDRAIAEKNRGATAKFEKDYRILLNQTRERLPEALLVLCEPFIAPVGRVKERWAEWEREIKEKQEIVRQLSSEYKVVFVPLQKTFDKATRRAPADYWIWDGIHPTVAGHELITREWLKQVSRKLAFLKKVI